MPTRARASAWIVALGLVVPCVAAAQDRTEREFVDVGSPGTELEFAL